MTSLTTTDAAPRERLLAGAGLFVTSLCWGSMVPVTADLLGAVDPLLIGAVRYLLALPLLALAVAALERGTNGGGWPRRLPWLRILALGGIGMAGFATALTFGVRNSDPITATAIFATAPVVAALIARLIDHRPLGRPVLIGMAAAVGGGVAVALAKPGSVAAMGFRGGELILIAGMALWTLYSIKAQHWLAPLGLSQLRVTLLTAGAAALGLWLVYLVSAALGWAALPARWPNAHTAVELAWLAAGPTALGVVLWNLGTARLGVAISTLYTNLAPVVSVGLSVAFLGAPTTPVQILGGAVVLLGVLWMQLYGLRPVKL